MDQKFRYGTLWLAIMLLAAIFLQSADSFHHLEKELTEKKCLHELGQNKSVVTHGHTAADHCFVCEFTFSQATATAFFSFEVTCVPHFVFYAFPNAPEIVQSFRGSLFALRGPPFFMV